MGTTARNPYLEFADRLLPDTVRNALSRPFYREVYGGLSVDFDAIDSTTIQALPFTSRPVVQARRRELLNSDDGFCETIFTGGTSGPPLIVPVGQRELRYIDEFHRQAQQQSGSPEGIRRALHLVTPFHGLQISTPVPMRLHRIGIYDCGSFDFARELLAGSHADNEAEPRCSVIAGIERLIRAFTLDTAASGYSPELGVPALILTNAQQLTPRWRRFYEEFWGARVVDRYGLAEIYGGATEDPDSGWYLFDPPCFAEIVEPFGDSRIVEGVGELVLSSLFPFQQAFPLIRYRTGDLVRATYALPGHEGCPAIRPLGRLSQAVATREGIIPACIFYEVFDDREDIARSDLLLDARQIRDRQLLGHPRYRAEADIGSDGSRIIVTAQPCEGASPQKEQLIAGFRSTHLRVMGAPFPDNVEIVIEFTQIDGWQNPSYSP